MTRTLTTRPNLDHFRGQAIVNALDEGGVAAAEIEMFTLEPAKLLKIDAGTLSIGVKADITLIDPRTGTSTGRIAVGGKLDFASNTARTDGRRAFRARDEDPARRG